MKKNFKKYNVRSLLVTGVCLLIVSVALITDSSFSKINYAEAGAGENVKGYAWSENIGWISFNSTNNSSLPSYGVNISPLTGIGYFSGYAWSENIGWISFNSAQTGYPAPQVDWTTGKVTGYVKVLNATGWDGLIKLSDDNVTAWNGKGVKVSTSTGQFSGYAWGSSLVGWVDFAPASAGINRVNIIRPPTVDIHFSFLDKIKANIYNLFEL